MQPRTNAGRRTRNATLIVLLMAALWAGTALTAGATHGDRSAPNGPVGPLTRAVEIIRG
ncbi:hypothetical protein [Streptomyces sp. MST-110588]|uniref:hypothetical protein n=1 Tax=Streptomyces sp. MST-110588 TaxID=2833628 RepID=UPI001F5CFBE7|nr:hypothetical protein [Streptomyces sp. MST-110588]UNO41031.1 hypothetical protein KGS77_17350 [Streptomyces sp. MST-110588]